MMARCVATILLVCASTSTLGNEGARDALREGRYETVLVMTKRIAVAQPSLAVNWYRMAIAAARTGDRDLGALALSNAKLHDPSLSFASSPARVDALQADLDGGVIAGITPEELEADARELFPVAAADVEPVPAAPAPPPVVDEQVTKALTEISSKIDQISGQRQTRPAQWWERLDIWAVGFLGLSLAIGSLIALHISRKAREIKTAQSRRFAAMSLAELVSFNRDITTLLRQRLAHHGHKDTALMQAIGRYLPAVELESGRSPVVLAELTKGCLLVDDAAPLDPAKPVLGIDSPESVHDAVLKRLRNQLKRAEAPARQA